MHYTKNLRETHYKKHTGTFMAKCKPYSLNMQDYVIQASIDWTVWCLDARFREVWKTRDSGLDIFNRFGICQAPLGSSTAEVPVNLKS